MTLTLPAWIRFGPVAVAFVIVLGNVTPQLPIWGFDYYVLHLPYGSRSELISNFVILAIGLYPVLAAKSDAPWHKVFYFVLAILALAVVALNLSIMVYFSWPLPDGAHARTSSIFAPIAAQAIACALSATYLAWSLSLVSLGRREMACVIISIAVSAAVAGNHTFDVTRAYQERESVSQGFRGSGRQISIPVE